MCLSVCLFLMFTDAIMSFSWIRGKLILCYWFYFRFMVRDFQYNEEEMKADKEQMTRLSTDKKKQFVCKQLSNCYSLLNIIQSSTMMLMSSFTASLRGSGPWLVFIWSNDNNGQSASAPQGPLVRWLKVNFSEAFIAWTHIKALRVFTESVLRYSVYRSV